MTKCAILIPIYREELSPEEHFAVAVSLRNLAGYDAYWIAPESLDTGYYERHFPVRLICRYPDSFFSSVQGYSSLLVSANFYQNFSAYEFVLICQTDAIVLKPELSSWLSKPFDYVGAPWPSGYSLQLKVPELSALGEIKCTAFVGNGGLSLRRVEACQRLINEFHLTSAEWATRGHAEDLFFGFLGTLSRNFVVPNVTTAATFAHDIDPAFLQQLLNGELPLGVHAWTKYDMPLWNSILERTGQFDLLNQFTGAGTI